MLNYIKQFIHLKILLVLALLFNAFGTQFVYWKLNRYAKTEMKEQLSRDISSAALTRLAYHNTQHVNLIDNGKEILQNGEKYDIITKQVTTDSVIFYCVHDKRESQLLAAYKKAFLNHHDSAKTGQPLKNILNIELQPGIFNQTFALKNYCTRYLYHYYNEIYPQKHSQKLPDPPPKFSI